MRGASTTAHSSAHRASPYDSRRHTILSSGALFVIAVIFVLCILQSFHASLTLQIGRESLSSPLAAWRKEALPFTGATVSVIGIAWLLPRWGPVRWQIGLVSALALAIALYFALQRVSYSMDILRYLWDGRLLTHGISPYQYMPADPHLKAFQHWPHWGMLAWKEWPEAYPPVAQAYFWLAAVLTNGSVVGWKLVMVANGIVGTLLFLRVLVARRKTMGGEDAGHHLSARDVRAFTLFLLFPPILLESYGAGHVDALAIPWILWAWLMGLRKQPIRLGLAIAMATAIKFYPVVLFAAFWKRGEWRFVWLSLCAFFVTLGIVFVPVIPHFHGFLAYYTKFSAMNYNGSIEHLLLGLFGAVIDRHSMWLVLVAELLMWFAVLFTRLSVLHIEEKAALLGLTFLLASPVVHPWYFLSLLPFAVVARDYATMWLAVSAHFTYDEVFLDVYIEYIPTYILYALRMAKPWL